VSLSLDSVFKLQSPLCPYLDQNCSLSKVDADEFSLVIRSLPLLRQMVEQAPIIEAYHRGLSRRPCEEGRPCPWRGCTVPPTPLSLQP
jgi:hypothetical protein